MPNSGKKEVTMNKVLFPKKDYVKELGRIFKSSKNSQKLVKALSKYHEKDIAEAITLLTPAERQHIYNVLDEHMIAEIFSYLDDAEKYLEELSLEKAARVVSYMDSDDAVDVLEKEMNITIFNRTNKGISVSKEGEEFLSYARQILDQAAILEDKYKGDNGGRKQYCISTQHYSFAVNAFVDLIKQFGQDEYDFSLRETQTYEIIEDVARLRSEIGILFINDFNEAVIRKILKSYELEFHELFTAILCMISSYLKYHYTF
jgi:hypothetical protein